MVIPGAGAAATATSLYRAAGSRATTAVLGTATGAATLAFIAVMLLLDLDWGLLRPMFLIIPGLVTLIGACAPPAADAAEHSGSMA